VLHSFKDRALAPQGSAAPRPMVAESGAAPQ